MLSEWLDDVRSTRAAFYFINFFSVKQIGMLVESLNAASVDGEEAPFIARLLKVVNPNFDVDILPFIREWTPVEIDARNNAPGGGGGDNGGGGAETKETKETKVTKVSAGGAGTAKNLLETCGKWLNNVFEKSATAMNERHHRRRSTGGRGGGGGMGGGDAESKGGGAGDDMKDGGDDDDDDDDGNEGKQGKEAKEGKESKADAGSSAGESKGDGTAEGKAEGKARGKAADGAPPPPQHRRRHFRLGQQVGLNTFVLPRSRTLNGRYTNHPAGDTVSNGVNVMQTAMVVDTVVSAYARVGLLPEASEVHICGPYTLWEEVQNLMYRWADAHLYGRGDRMYCLAHIECLSFDFQHRIVQMLHALEINRSTSSLATRARLLIVSGQEHQHLLAQYAQDRININPLPVEVLREVGEELATRFCEGIAVHHSPRPGSGKSFAVRSEAGGELIYVHVPIHGPMPPSLFIRRLISSLLPYVAAVIVGLNPNGENEARLSSQFANGFRGLPKALSVLSDAVATGEMSLHEAANKWVSETPPEVWRKWLRADSEGAGAADADLDRAEVGVLKKLKVR